MAKGKIFEYAVLFHPKAKKTKVDGEDVETPKSVIIVDVQRVLAGSDGEAAMVAARAIPGDYADKLEQCEVVVRPF